MMPMRCSASNRKHLCVYDPWSYAPRPADLNMIMFDMLHHGASMAL